MCYYILAGREKPDNHQEDENMTYEMMIEIYAMLTAAHLYFLGFTVNGSLYYVALNWEELKEYFKFDKAAQSKGGHKKIRITVKAQQKKALIESGKAILLGSENLLNYNDKYNNGEHFERVITERFTDQKWQKDSIPFYVAGDAEINGEQVQIKLDGAELTNEKLMMKLRESA